MDRDAVGDAQLLPLAAAAAAAQHLARHAPPAARMNYRVGWVQKMDGVSTGHSCDAAAILYDDLYWNP